MKKEMTNVEMIEDEVLEDVEGGLIAELGVAAMMAFGAVTPAAAEMTQPEAIVETEHVIHQRNQASQNYVDNVYGYRAGNYTTNYNGSRVRAGASTSTSILNPGLAAGTALYLDIICTGTTDVSSVWGHLPSGGWICIKDSQMQYCAPVATPAPTGVTYHVVASGLNIRKAPNRNTGAIVGSMQCGTYFDVLETQYDSYGALWGRAPQGWVCLVESNGTVYAAC